jgi:hypothetical protein
MLIINAAFTIHISDWHNVGTIYRDMVYFFFLFVFLFACKFKIYLNVFISIRQCEVSEPFQQAKPKPI